MNCSVFDLIRYEDKYYQWNYEAQIWSQIKFAPKFKTSVTTLPAPMNKCKYFFPFEGKKIYDAARNEVRDRDRYDYIDTTTSIPHLSNEEIIIGQQTVIREFEDIINDRQINKFIDIFDTILHSLRCQLKTHKVFLFNLSTKSLCKLIYECFKDVAIIYDNTRTLCECKFLPACIIAEINTEEEYAILKEESKKRKLPLIIYSETIREIDGATKIVGKHTVSPSIRNEILVRNVLVNFSIQAHCNAHLFSQ